MTTTPHALRILLKGLLLCSSIICAAPAFASQQFGVGYHVGQNVSQVEKVLLSGPFSFRADAEWQWVEQTQGVLAYPSNLTSELDPVTNAVVAAGAQPLIVLDYGDRFYDGGGNPTDSAGIAAFARYAGYMAAHYKGKISQFEIWNEWNTNSSASNPAVGTATAYVQLLKAAYQAIKAANPAATVIAGAVTNLDTDWINQFVQAGGLSYADGFSLHPYVHSRARRPATPRLSRWLGSHFSHALSWLFGVAQAQSAPPVVPGTPEDAMAWVDQVNGVLSAAAGHTVPIYITEIGWATNIGQYGFAPATAAAYLQRFLLLARTRHYIAGVWWYDLMDDGADQTDYLDRFGLLQQNGTPKPAYNALLQIRNELLAPGYATQGVGPNGEITITGQLASGAKYYAAWLSTDDFTRSIASTTAASMIASGYTVAAPGNGNGSILSATPLLLVQSQP